MSYSLCKEDYSNWIDCLFGTPHDLPARDDFLGKMNYGEVVGDVHNNGSQNNSARCGTTRTNDTSLMVRKKYHSHIVMVIVGEKNTITHPFVRPKLMERM